MGKKLTIEEMQSIAESKGGKCLSDTYVNSHSKLQWRCSEGHEWWARSCDIKNAKSWCPECSKIRVGKITTKRNKEGILTIEEMQDIAISLGGKCLSKEYKGVFVKLQWECKKKHHWMSRPSSIRRGNWCPECARESLKLTIKKIKEKAESKGGKCLSDVYIDVYTKLLWECSEGHQWYMSYSNMRTGTWCRKCNPPKTHSKYNPTYNMEDMINFAKIKGGKCLSTEYINTNVKLRWICDKGHVWMAVPYSIARGSWCPICAGKRKITMNDMHKMAKSNNGKCLSNKYKNDNTKLEWECSKKHRWFAVPRSIKKGTWCPFCSSFKSEKRCRKIFKTIFNKPFGKARPDWLINPKTGWRMEFDGYNEEEKIAFEYNGHQHYMYPNNFHRTKQKYIDTIERDKVKEKLCIEFGVKLIIIPFNTKDFEKYIKEQLGVTN